MTNNFNFYSLLFKNWRALKILLDLRFLTLFCSSFFAYFHAIFQFWPGCQLFIMTHFQRYKSLPSAMLIAVVAEGFTIRFVDQTE